MPDKREHLRMLNLGCGSRTHSDWINVDIASSDPSVLKHDLSTRFPFNDNEYDVVYHSNIIEHFRVPDALPFMQECYRVLKPGGVVRVATPDLERLCRLYLDKLGQISTGNSTAESDYDWILLEMYDQTVREKSTGLMGEFLGQDPLVNEEFILERIGQEGRGLIADLRNARQQRSIRPVSEVKPQAPPLKKPNWLKHPKKYFNWLVERRVEERFEEKLKQLGTDWERALEIGRFRLSGEVHHWMYDRFSLGRLMQKAGFINPLSRTASESGITNWTSYNLDTMADGSVTKPDSFFMEATKG